MFRAELDEELSKFNIHNIEQFSNTFLEILDKSAPKNSTKAFPQINYEWNSKKGYNEKNTVKPKNLKEHIYSRKLSCKSPKGNWKSIFAGLIIKDVFDSRKFWKTGKPLVKIYA